MTATDRSNTFGRSVCNVWREPNRSKRIPVDVCAGLLQQILVLVVSQLSVCLSDCQLYTCSVVSSQSVIESIKLLNASEVQTLVYVCARGDKQFLRTPFGTLSRLGVAVRLAELCDTSFY